MNAEHAIPVAPMTFDGVEYYVRELYAADGIHFQRLEGETWVDFEFHATEPTA